MVLSFRVAAADIAGRTWRGYSHIQVPQQAALHSFLQGLLRGTSVLTDSIGLTAKHQDTRDSRKISLWYGRAGVREDTRTSPPVPQVRRGY